MRLGNAVEIVATRDGKGSKLKNQLQGKIPAMFSANSLAYWLGSSTTYIAQVPLSNSQAAFRFKTSD